MRKKSNSSRRPKRKRKRSFDKCSQDTGVQTSSQHSEHSEHVESDKLNDSDSNKRRTEESEERSQLLSKRIKIDYDTDIDSESKIDVAPLIKTVSDPALTVHTHTQVNICQSSTDNTNIRQSKSQTTDDTNSTVKRETSTDKKDKADNTCIICTTEPKSGVFVHGRIAHICCCYKCAVEVWRKSKRCPVCNCRVSNVLRAVVM